MGVEPNKELYRMISDLTKITLPSVRASNLTSMELKKKYFNNLPPIEPQAAYIIEEETQDTQLHSPQTSPK